MEVTSITPKSVMITLTACNLPLTGVGVVNLIITDMGVMEITATGLKLLELAPGVTREAISAATGCVLH